jgi:MFS family permease
VASYLLAVAAVQPLGSRLGDRYGRRRLFLTGFMLSLTATVVAALSWTVEPPRAQYGETECKPGKRKRSRSRLRPYVALSVTELTSLFP